jgi:NAD(P)-dependent dehydrogenase (short-subunit alcohol dehydrogenase family)
MTKRTIIITGGNAGLGLAYARELGRDANTLVAIACRDLLRGERAATALGQQGVQARVLPLDLADLASVRHFPDVLREAALPPLAGLICNAGVQDGGTSRRTVDGFEETFGVNHLGHYLLARLLLPMMTCNASVVFVASNTHDSSTGTGLPEPSYPGALALAADRATGSKAGQKRYTESKLCNIYTAYELARRLEACPDARHRSIRVNAFDPGMVPGTGLARSYPAPLRFLWSYVLPVLTLFQRNVNRPAASARRMAALMTGGMGELTGKYVSMGQVTASSALSYDQANAADLWEASAVMTGLSTTLGDGGEDAPHQLMGSIMGSLPEARPAEAA